MEEIEHIVNTTTRMLVVFFEKRCSCYAYMCQDEYKMRPNGPIYNNNEDENPKIPKRNPRR